MHLTDEQCEAIRTQLSSMKPWQDECAERERDRVALMLVSPEYVDSFLDGEAEHFQCKSYWRDKKLWALFVLLLELRIDNEPLGYVAKLTKHGKTMLEQRKTSDNTDRLGH